MSGAGNNRFRPVAVIDDRATILQKADIQGGAFFQRLAKARRVAASQ